MTEDQIEQRVARYLQALDRQLSAGTKSLNEYDKEVRHLNAWAKAKYDSRGQFEIGAALRDRRR